VRRVEVHGGIIEEANRDTPGLQISQDRVKVGTGSCEPIKAGNDDLVVVPRERQRALSS
jgi:hypothetical protein